jgi:WYL domain-containing protein
MLRTETGTERLVRATLEHRVASFTYRGHRRTVEPHLIGLHEAGEAVLLAYQTGGASASGNLPGWRTFVLTEIDAVDAEGQTFSPQTGFTPEAHRMVEIFARV